MVQYEKMSRVYDHNNEMDQMLFCFITGRTIVLVEGREFDWNWAKQTNGE